jgi:hypothetical protein
VGIIGIRCIIGFVFGQDVCSFNLLIDLGYVLLSKNIYCKTISVVYPKTFFGDSDPQKNFLFRFGYGFRVRIRILQTYILGQTISKFSFNGPRTFSESNITKKKLCNCENMCFFTFNNNICHALLLKYTVWIRIRIFIWIRILLKVSDSFEFGSATLINHDSDGYLCAGCSGGDCWALTLPTEPCPLIASGSWTLPVPSGEHSMIRWCLDYRSHAFSVKFELSR